MNASTSQNRKLIMIAALVLLSAIIVTTSASSAVDTTPGARASVSQAGPAPVLEGCISCHGKIEPMHKYGTTGALDQLKDGRDALGLSCTACHGGNPVATKKEDAHVRARFPKQWQRDGKYTGANPERTNTLLLKESVEFVRFINPGDL